MPISREQFSRRASTNVREAMALALRRHLEGLNFHNAGGSFQFAAVFDEWPSYVDRYVPPSACVLPGDWKYGDWAFTPHLLEDTWEVEGEPGFGLYKIAEIEVDLEISLRSNNLVERGALMLGIEESFVDPGLLMNEAAGPRYGILLDLPEYYGLSGRFALTSARVIDDETRSMQEQRDAVLVINAQAPVVRVGPVFPLKLRIRLSVDGNDEGI